MTMLATVEKKELLTLADYEARIYLYKEQIGTGFIGIGRTLLEAKEANVVPHGEWEAWMTRTTGLAPRQAQRCMQAAREIKDGSAMARLEMSKALLLLSSGLDEETRESIAQRAADDGIGYRDLKEQLQKAQQSAAAHAQKEQRDRANPGQRGSAGAAQTAGAGKGAACHGDQHRGAGTDRQPEGGAGSCGNQGRAQGRTAGAAAAGTPAAGHG